MQGGTINHNDPAAAIGVVVPVVPVVLAVVQLYRHLQKSEVALCGFHTNMRTVTRLSTTNR